MMGRGNTGPVYPWFGKDIRDGIPLAIENYALLRRLWTEDVAAGSTARPCRIHSTPRPLDGIPVRLARVHPLPEIAEQAAYYGDGFFHNNIFWPMSHTKQMVQLYRRRFEHYGHGSADQAIVGLGGQVFMRLNSQDAVREFRPYFDNAPSTATGRARGLQPRDAAHRRQPAAGDRALRRHGRRRGRLPAAAVPHGPRRPAAPDRAGAARDPRW